MMRNQHKMGHMIRGASANNTTRAKICQRHGVIGLFFPWMHLICIMCVCVSEKVAVSDARLMFLGRHSCARLPHCGHTLTTLTDA